MTTTTETFRRMGAALNESLITARTQWSVFAAGMNQAIEHAAEAQSATTYARRIGLAPARAEAIISDHVAAARTSACPVDWSRVRDDMAGEAGRS